MVGEILQHRRDAAGDPALHVDRAAAIEKTVLHVAREGAVAPGGFVARRYHVGVAGERDVRRLRADPGIEIVDIGGPGLAEGDAVDLEAVGFEESFENAERAGVGRRDGRTADQVLRDRESIIHAFD